MSFEPSSAPLFQVPWFLGWSKNSPARSFVHIIGSLGGRTLLLVRSSNRGGIRGSKNMSDS